MLLHRAYTATVGTNTDGNREEAAGEAAHGMSNVGEAFLNAFNDGH